MEGSLAERRPSLSPVRLLVGSLIGGAGITLFVLFFGGSPASAGEPAPSAPPAHSVLGTVASLRVTVSAVTEPVRQALPEPVKQVVAPVAEPVSDAVAGVAASAPASRAVAPVTAAVDSIANAVPLTHELLGSDPVRTAVAPVADAVDHLLSSIAGITVGVVVPVLGPPTPGTPGLPDLRLVTLLPAVPETGAIGGNSVAEPATAVAKLWAGPGHPDADRGSTAGAALPAPPGYPGGTPFGQPEGTATGSSAPGSPSGASAPAVAGNDFALAAVAAGDNAPLTGDRLPSSPVADHDSSPD
jgi:hypothetical protein